MSTVVWCSARVLAGQIRTGPPLVAANSAWPLLCAALLPCPCPQVLSPGRLAGLAGLAGAAPQQQHHQHLSTAAAAEADAMRLARYALRRCDAIVSLLQRLATVPEMIEMARATGLTLGQASKLTLWFRNSKPACKQALRWDWLPARLQQFVRGVQVSEAIQAPLYTLCLPVCLLGRATATATAAAAGLLSGADDPHTFSAASHCRPPGAALAWAAGGDRFAGAHFHHAPCQRRSVSPWHCF